MRDGLDHILFAASDLGEGCDAVEAATGVKPAFGGAHPGRGTCNALAGLGAGFYLEVIAPDPAQKSDGELIDRLRALEQPALCWWAGRCGNLARVSDQLAARGLATSEVKRGHRRTGEGELVEWSALYLPVTQFGAATPFLIDWGEGAHHPSRTAPHAGELVEFEISLPDLPAYRSALEGVEFGPLVTCRGGRAPSMTSRIRTNEGTVIELRTPADFPLSYPPRP